MNADYQKESVESKLVISCRLVFNMIKMYHKVDFSKENFFFACSMDTECVFRVLVASKLYFRSSCSTGTDKVLHSFS